MTQEGRRKKVFSIGNYLFSGVTLGKGNFARVEEAVHTILNVRVAIKIMDINDVKEEYVIKNLYREAKIMAKLNHPCIVNLFQTMQRANNVYYLVTEIASGGDLCTFVKNQAKGRLEEKLSRVYARQFVSALSHMHSMGVVHRDLKMDNVMLNKEQTQIKIVDFGLSNIWTSDAPLKTHCGSPEYAAPELFITGKQYGSEVDLWSLGIILYGMMLGKLPFVTSCCQQLQSQEKRKQLVSKINKGLSSEHRKALSAFSPDFRGLMCRLLMADPLKRINMKELMVHPWITDKGKRMIRTNPLRTLDSYEMNMLIGKLSSIVQMEPKQINQTIMQEPFGKVAGIYNILKRKFQLNQLKGDGSSKTMPSLTIFELANLSCKAQEKDKTRKLIKFQPNQTQKVSKDYSGNNISIKQDEQSMKSIKINPNPSKAKTKFQLTKLRPATMQERPINKNASDEPGRPVTVNTVGEKKPTDYRIIKSPNLRRKVYSATVNKKINSPLASTRKPDSRGGDNADKESTVTIEKIVSKETKIPAPPKPDKSKIDPKVLGKKPLVQKQQAKPPTAKFEPSPKRNALSAPLHKMIAKSLKTAVVMTKGSTAVKVPAKKKDTKEKEADLSRPSMAFGDFVRTKSSAQAKMAIYDPIARSIADYVANNISDKVNRCPWLKK
ncbi:unnamed protein product [Phyllotreta striolata]|uniref:Protein kinase domain-containing protein n=1 Tax=Phyllotreta striolata TaxID=444603 RepID=A0A9N9XMU6_PHYSR|nr:unnamed protein product [Phyllotreta striolata]